MPWSEVCAIVGKPRVPLLAVAHQPGRRAAAPAAPLGPAARSAAAPALRPLARQHALQAGRLPLPVHERGHGRGVRARAAPREDDRRQAPDLPVRARGRRLLPPLARRRPARLRNSPDGARRCRPPRPRRARHARRRRAPQRDDRARWSTRSSRRSTRSRPTHDVGAVVITGEPPAFCSGADVAALGSLSEAAERRRTALGHVDLRRLPARAALAAADGRRGQRPRGRRGLNLALACDVRLAGESARFDTRFLRIGLHPGRRARVDARARGRPAGRGRDGAVRRRGRRRRAPRRSASRGRAIPTTSSLDAARRVRGRRGRGAPKPLARPRPSATLREAPWQPDFDAAVAAEIDAPGVVARSGLVPTPMDVDRRTHPGHYDRRDAGLGRPRASGRGARSAVETFRCPTCIGVLDATPSRVPGMSHEHAPPPAPIVSVRRVASARTAGRRAAMPERARRSGSDAAAQPSPVVRHGKFEPRRSPNPTSARRRRRGRARSHLRLRAMPRPVADRVPHLRHDPSRPAVDTVPQPDGGRRTRLERRGRRSTPSSTVVVAPGAPAAAIRTALTRRHGASLRRPRSRMLAGSQGADRSSRARDSVGE